MNKEVLKEKGITLIALVVTIVILLILAGVTLSLSLSQNGLFDRAQNAADKYKKAQENEEKMIEELEMQFEKPLVQTITDIDHGNIKAEDSLGNPVTIPGGFRFAGEDSDTVEDGIVIEDGEGNQFVWIPVSNIDGDNKETGEEKNLIKKENGDEVEITLRKVYV